VSETTPQRPDTNGRRVAEFFRTDLPALLEPLERSRRRLRAASKATVWATIALGVAGTAVFLPAMLRAQGAVEFTHCMLVIVAAGPVLCALAMYLFVRRRQLEDLVRSRVVAAMIASLYPGLVYEPKGRIPAEWLDRGRLFPESPIRTKDRVRGSLRGEEMECAEMATWYADGYTHYGVYAIVRSPLDTPTPTRAFPRRMSRGLERALRELTVLPEPLADPGPTAPEFDREFVVLKEELAWRRASLPKGLSARALEARRKVEGELRLAVVGPDMHVALETAPGIFVLDSEFSGGALLREFKEFQALLDILADLAAAE
jgi:hypothetical protein